MEANEETNTEYISYNSLNRPPMFFGVPIMVFVGLVSALFFIGFPLIIYVNAIVGALFGALVLVLFLFIKVSSENDPNAIDGIKLKLKGFAVYSFKKVLIIRGNV